MGTNYYLEESAPCPTCGHKPKNLHIGKSSMGWCFSLHVIPEEWINSLEDWKARWSKPGVVIRDEYGHVTPPEEMLSVITERDDGRQREEKPFGYSSWAEFYSRNNGCPGPGRLIRHAIGRYCVGHGEGTWDLIPGGFS